jgi:hypothetical protein
MRPPRTSTRSIGHSYRPSVLARTPFEHPHWDLPVQAAMRTTRVVVRQIDAQHPLQVPLVTDQEPSPGTRSARCEPIPSNLYHHAPARVSSGPGKVHVLSVHPDGKENVEPGQGDRLDGAEIRRQCPRCPRTQELAPARTKFAARRRPAAVSAELRTDYLSSGSPSEPGVQVRSRHQQRPATRPPRRPTRSTAASPPGEAAA